MLQKEALLMPQAEVSESDTVTTQGFVRQKADYMYVWSENINHATGEKLVGKLGISGIFYGKVASLAHYPPSSTRLDYWESTSINAIRINNGPWIEGSAEAFNALYEVAGDNEPGDPVRVEVRL